MTTLYIVTHPDCPPCQFVKKVWIPKLSILFEVKELTPDEVQVQYTPYFFLLTDLNEVIELNSHTYSTLVKDIYNGYSKLCNAKTKPD